jgi:hypothetical protein
LFPAPFRLKVYPDENYGCLWYILIILGNVIFEDSRDMEPFGPKTVYIGCNRLARFPRNDLPAGNPLDEWLDL